MAGTATRRLTGLLAAPLALALLGAPADGARAQGSPAQTPPEMPSVAKECGDTLSAELPLPNSAAALQKRGKLKILAIGASTVAVVGGAREGNPPLLEQILEKSVKGLDVEIINRGFSGELADAAAQRLKVEVALNHPDVVIWQVGTNDAFAQVPVDDFQASVGNMVRWLKEHNVDVILVGLHYLKHLAKDPHYQAIRVSLNQLASAENVLRITRYEAMEVLARTMRESGRPEPRDFGLSESGYNCMAQYVARAIAVGLFAKPALHPPAPSR
jgi:lysophospholipase L1-like esterase